MFGCAEFSFILVLRMLQTHFKELSSQLKSYTWKCHILMLDIIRGKQYNLSFSLSKSAYKLKKLKDKFGSQN